MGKPKHYFDLISLVYNMARGAILYSMQHSLFKILWPGSLRIVYFAFYFCFILKIKVRIYEQYSRVKCTAPIKRCFCSGKNAVAESTLQKIVVLWIFFFFFRMLTI